MFRSLLRPRVLTSFVASAFLIGSGEAIATQDAAPEGPGTETPANAQGPDIRPPQSPEIRFNFKNQSWDQVLDWFSRTTSLPIVREVPVPSGTVDYLSPRSYDLPEALRLLNILLQTQGVMLRVEADRLHLQKLEDMKRENIPTYTRTLPDSIPADQIVTLRLPLTNASAESVAEQLKDLVAGYGSVTPLKQQNAVILVETAGVGQVEVEIGGKTNTTVVVVNPGWGDSVQANKAGLMEIADVFVINKADRKGVEETRRDLEQMLDLSDLPGDAWRPPIVPTIGNTGEGVPALWEAVLAHRAYAETSGQLSERRRFRSSEELREIVANRLRERARQLCTGDRWDEVTAEVVDHRLDPWSAADEMLAPVEA